jgi:DNA-binding MarR family transcriptional regulator
MFRKAPPVTPTPDAPVARGRHGGPPRGRGSGGGVSSAHEHDLEDHLDVVLRGSRVVTAVIAGSLARADDAITVLQLRVLVLAATRPGTTATDVAEAMDVHVSSASRTVDRLVASGFLERHESREDRRRLELVPTTEGQALLEGVMADRRRQLRDILRRMSAEDVAHLSAGLGALADAAGEPKGPSPLIP